MLTKFSWIFECRASFPGPCASSGGRLPAALFMVVQLDSKGAKVYKGSRRASGNRKTKESTFCSSYSFLQSRMLVAPSGYLLRIISIYFLTPQCSPYSHCQSSVHGAPSFRYYTRPRCFAAAWWFRFRGRELRPEDACQKRFSWFFMVFAPQSAKSV